MYPVRCAYCDTQLHSAAEHTWDHVVPRSRGGTNDSTNLVHACKPCNAAKASHPVELFLRNIGRLHTLPVVRRQPPPAPRAEPVKEFYSYCGICKLKKRSCSDCR